MKRRRSVHRLRVQQDRGRPLLAARVRSREAQLQVRRVLVVRSVERSAGHTLVALERMLVAVRRAVMEDERPREPGRRKGPVLCIGRMSTATNRVTNLPGSGSARRINHDGGPSSTSDHRNASRVSRPPQRGIEAPRASTAQPFGPRVRPSRKPDTSCLTRPSV